MKIDLRELHEGTNPVSFEVSADDFDTWAQEADVLYHGASEPCRVRLTVDRYGDLLTIRGDVRAPMRFECARCLAERSHPLDMAVKWTLVPAKSISAGMSEEEELELTADDLDVSFYSGEEIDLGELVREAVLLELEPNPRCRVDECEGDRYLSPPSEAPPSAEIDPRWAGLAALQAKKAGG